MDSNSDISDSKVHALNHHFTLLSVPCLNEEASAKVYE